MGAATTQSQGYVFDVDLLIDGRKIARGGAMDLLRHLHRLGHKLTFFSTAFSTDDMRSVLSQAKFEEADIESMIDRSVCLGLGKSDSVRAETIQDTMKGLCDEHESQVLAMVKSDAHQKFFDTLGETHLVFAGSPDSQASLNQVWGKCREAAFSGTLASRLGDELPFCIFSADPQEDARLSAYSRAHCNELIIQATSDGFLRFTYTVEHEGTSVFSGETFAYFGGNQWEVVTSDNEEQLKQRAGLVVLSERTLRYDGVLRASIEALRQNGNHYWLEHCTWAPQSQMKAPAAVQSLMAALEVQGSDQLAQNLAAFVAEQRIDSGLVEDESDSISVEESEFDQESGQEDEDQNDELKRNTCTIMPSDGSGVMEVHLYGNVSERRDDDGELSVIDGFRKEGSGYADDLSTQAAREERKQKLALMDDLLRVDWSPHVGPLSRLILSLGVKAGCVNRVEPGEIRAMKKVMGLFKEEQVDERYTALLSTVKSMKESLWGRFVSFLMETPLKQLAPRTALLHRMIGLVANLERAAVDDQRQEFVDIMDQAARIAAAQQSANSLFVIEVKQNGMHERTASFNHGAEVINDTPDAVTKPDEHLKELDLTERERKVLKSQHQSDPASSALVTRPSVKEMSGHLDQVAKRAIEAGGVPCTHHMAIDDAARNAGKGAVVVGKTDDSGLEELVSKKPVVAPKAAQVLHRCKEVGSGAFNSQAAIGVGGQS